MILIICNWDSNICHASLKAVLAHSAINTQQRGNPEQANEDAQMISLVKKTAVLMENDTVRKQRSLTKHALPLVQTIDLQTARTSWNRSNVDRFEPVEEHVGQLALTLLSVNECWLTVHHKIYHTASKRSQTMCKILCFVCQNDLVPLYHSLVFSEDT